jgi:hypothetical protein
MAPTARAREQPPINIGMTAERVTAKWDLGVLTSRVLSIRCYRWSFNFRDFLLHTAKASCGQYRVQGAYISASDP